MQTLKMRDCERTYKSETEVVTSRLVSLVIEKMEHPDCPFANSTNKGLFKL